MVASGAIDQTLVDLRERGVAYDDDGAVWLRSTDYGDDKDRVLVRSNGEFTYLLPDIAYHRDKFDRGYDRLIDVWGADHHGYVHRMKAAVAALGHSPDEVEPVITQLVRLLRDGQPVKLSKRTGDIIELRELLDEVGPDAVRLTYLLQSIDSPADRRPRRDRAAVDGQPGLLRADGPRPAVFDRQAWPPSGA